MALRILDSSLNILLGMPPPCHVRIIGYPLLFVNGNAAISIRNPRALQHAIQHAAKGQCRNLWLE
jgi:hypothetical protein